MKRTIIVLLLLSTMIGGAIVNVSHAQPPPLPSPTELVAVDGVAPGTVRLTWGPVDGAPYYHIGWVATTDLRATVAAGRPWHEVFRTMAIENIGQSGHTVAYLVPGEEYRFIIGISQDRFTHPQVWSKWTAPLTLATGPSVCSA